MTYEEFIKRKAITISEKGIKITADDIHPVLRPHQAAIVRWMVQGGRRACFASFGLGKTIIQLETLRIICQRTGGKGLIIMPLGIRQEFMRDAALIGVSPKFIRHKSEIDDEHTIYLTNYETVRDGKLDTSYFIVVSLDEAAVLRGFGGSATFREFMAVLAGDRKTMNERIRGRETLYRFVATATPSPNEYIELLAYAAFLGIGDVSGLKTRFFKRNSTKADDLTIMPGKEQEFWLWVSGWGIFVESPADLGFDDSGYVLPGLEVHWHELQIQTKEYNYDRDGQGQLIRDVKLGVSAAAREKKISMAARVKKVIEIVEASDDEQIVIWCDQDAEQRAIEQALKKIGVTFSSLYGSEHIDKRDKLMQEWRDKQTRVFLSKSVMYGAGCNLQQSHTMIFAGINFKFYAFIQALHREYRFLQSHVVQLHLIYTDAEISVRQSLERKWTQHKEMVQKMTEIIREYGLSHSALMQHLQRAFGVERIEASGENWKMVHNDCVLETRNMPENSVGLILTSIPFSTQYEYSPNLMDFGHTDNNQHFFDQMEYLTPELLRVLQPGRLMLIHVKDRIVPGGLTGLGFQTAYPLHAKCIEHYTTCPECREKMLKDKKHVCTHRFGYMGMKTIVTDVVRENNQTYRLGWTEQCKDGTKMGVGMPEYLLIFRKPPTDSQDAYADNPVVKTKRKYTRAKWQVDAHGFTRSSGNRLLDPEELRNLSHDQIFKLFREYSLENVYSFEQHVKIGETLDEHGRLPVTFMLLQPQSWHPDVWTDITRMLTLNSTQAQQGKTQHLCPMQLDLADRAIEQWSNPGDVVYDPFAGIGTVPYRAVMLGRYGLGCELSHPYWLDALAYCKAAEDKVLMPDLFSVIEELKCNAA